MRLMINGLLACLAVLSITGCAVMTVDIDVYKGPLSNNSEVQIEQVASLAIGAKPLLIQLRDRLEISKEKQRANWQHGLFQTTQKKSEHFMRAEYRPGHIVPDEGKHVTGLWNEYARQVNSVLSLYGRRADLPEPFNSMWSDIILAVREYAEAYERINPGSDEATTEWEIDFASPLWAPDAECSQHDDPIEALRCELGQAYAIFWVPVGVNKIRFDKDKIVDSSNDLVNFINSNPAMTAVQFGLIRIPDTLVFTNADSFFEWLADKRTRRLHSRFLFPNDKKKSEHFERRVGEIATGYLDARRAIERVLVRSAELCRAVEEDNGDVLTDKKRRELTRISRDLLVQTLENDTDANDLLNAIQSAAAGNDLAEHCTKLLTEHRNKKTKTNPDTYGLAHGPTHELASELVQTIGGFQYAGGLEQGRPVEGLVELVNAYVEARMAEPYDFTASATDPVRSTRDRLLVALVHFAEKVRTLGNLSILMNEMEEIDTYQMVLQAVANSILSQIDELANAGEHASNLRNTGRDAAEERAASAVWGTGDGEKKGLSKLDIDFPGEAKRPVDVIDEVIALLEHEHARALATGGNNDTAQNLRLAATSLRERRGNQLRLIPASVYLRNSYPATSLQANPALTGDNMLLGPSRPSRAIRETISNIDKQYWQSVNHVRVSGGGKTNYVVTKDDLGNWYVKSYASSVKKIVNSAKSLAMFAIAQPLAAGGFDMPPTNSAGNSRTNTGPQTRFERQIAAFDSAQKTQAKEDYARARTLHASAKNVLGTSYAEARAALGQKKDPAEALPDEHNDRLLQELAAVYHHMRAKAEQEIPEKDRPEEIRKLNTALGAPLAVLLRERDSALARLETTLNILTPALE